MNDEAARQSRNATTEILALKGSTEGPRLTSFIAAVANTIRDARDELGPDAYKVFVDIVTIHVGAECGRLVFGELLRDQRAEREAA
jgi:hypothetical protein